MSLPRWLNPLTRWRKAEPAAPEPSASTPAVRVAAAPSKPTTPPLATATPADPTGSVDDTDMAATEPLEPSAERHVAFFRWLVGVSPAASAVAHAPSPALLADLLERIDVITLSDTLRAALLPRAPHVVPQLMKTLREENYSSSDVASRISKDAVLTAEVVRSATGAFQRGANDDEEIDLARAVVMIGTQGLRRAIANVVLRPIFDAKGDTLSARAATQIWKDADRKARLGAAFATVAGLDPFDGYLAGLLHNSGWTAVLRAIDSLEDVSIGAAELTHAEVVPQLLRRRDALFGAIVGPWNLSPGLDALAAEIGAVGIDAASSPLGIALRGADRLAALRALTGAGQRGSGSIAGWASLPRPVRDCYGGLDGALA